MELNLPSFEVKLTESGNKTFIFDEIRRKNVVLTPEEWVRQHFVQFLLNQWNERFRVRSDLVLGSEHLVVELIEVNELL